MDYQNLISSLQNLYSITPTRYEIEEIENAVINDIQANQIKIDTPDKIMRLCNVNLTDNSKRLEAVVPRQIAMSLMYAFSDMSLESVGWLFNGRDHSTVSHAIKRMSEAIDSDDRIVVVSLELHFNTLYPNFKRYSTQLRKKDYTKFIEIERRVTSLAFSLKLISRRTNWLRRQNRQLLERERK